MWVYDYYVELRQLRYFVAVADELNFGRAAKRLCIAGPSLSQQIRALERDLKVQLFDRDRRSVALTATGAALLPSARALVEQADELRRSAIGLSLPPEPVRLGYVEWLPTDLFQRTASVANVHVDTWVLPSHEQIMRVATGGIDLAICWVQCPQLDEHGLVARPLHAEPLTAVSTGEDSSPVDATDTVVLLDADERSWRSWNRYAEQFAAETGAGTVRISNGGIAGPMFFEHVRRLGRPVLNSPKAQNADRVPGDIVRRAVKPPAPHWTWSLVSRRTESRRTVSAVIGALTTNFARPDLDLDAAWLPANDPYRRLIMSAHNPSNDMLAGFLQDWP